MKKQNNQGFTLIELLFVAAVMGVIALLGVNTYRQRALSVKIERTSLEIQEILKAGATFFLNQKKWPKAGEQTGDLFQKQYLPNNETLMNPWDESYQYEPFSNIPTEPEKIKLFQVETKVPTEGIANQIAAKLSNSEVELMEDGYKVKAQILLAGESNNDDKKASQYLIHSIGTRVLTKESKTASHLAYVEFKPLCPKGMKPALLVGLSGVGAPSRVLAETFGGIEVIDKQCGIDRCEFRVDLRYFTLDCGLTWSGGCWTKDDKKVFVKYIAYCEQSKA